MYLTAADAIRIWESSHRRPAAERAVAALAAVCPNASRDELHQMTLGECNARLLELREQLFGSQLNASSECPNCGARFEFNLNTGAFPRAPKAEALREFDLEVDQYWVRFRLLTLEDLNVAGGSGDVTAARQRLLQRCILAARHLNRVVTVEEMPESVIAELAAGLLECDPEAEALINLTCPACDLEFQLPFDVASFFSSEIEAEARRLLREVHVLALSYGWHEADILGMSAIRRQSYLDQLDQ